jgi:hypothetical protein
VGGAFHRADDSRAGTGSARRSAPPTFVGAAHASDALHVALATVTHADMIVSWNFRHIVHFDKMREFNAVNVREGYGRLEILSPLEVV